jgi:CBS domain-containing protein
MNLIFIYMGLESTSISQCMTKNVKTMQSTGSLFNVCKIMKDNKIGCVVVVNEFNDPVGIITERDIINNLTIEDAGLRSQVVNIMSNPIITLLETNSIMDALQTMTTNNFRRLPVINKEEKLVGIVTNKDIFKIIINNKGLLADYYNNKNFQPSYSLLQDNKDQIFESFFKS